MSLALAALLSAHALATPPSFALDGDDQGRAPTPEAQAVPSSDGDAAPRSEREARGTESSAHTFSVTVQPIAFAMGFASLQTDFRMTEHLSIAGHGFAGQVLEIQQLRTESDGSRDARELTARSAGAGLGLKVARRNFDRGLFVGLDVDVSLDHFQTTQQTLQLVDTGYGLEAQYAETEDTRYAMTVRTIPRVGWKYTGKKGLTFCTDFGLGTRHVLYHDSEEGQPLVLAPIAVRTGTRVGWSF